MNRRPLGLGKKANLCSSKFDSYERATPMSPYSRIVSALDGRYFSMAQLERWPVVGGT